MADRFSSENTVAKRRKWSRGHGCGLMRDRLWHHEQYVSSKWCCKHQKSSKVKASQRLCFFFNAFTPYESGFACLTIKRIALRWAIRGGGGEMEWRPFFPELESSRLCWHEWGKRHRFICSSMGSCGSETWVPQATDWTAPVWRSWRMWYTVWATPHPQTWEITSVHGLPNQMSSRRSQNRRAGEGRDG